MKLQNYRRCEVLVRIFFKYHIEGLLLINYDHVLNINKLHDNFMKYKVCIYDKLIFYILKIFNI